eukprot:4479684-Amphidinium_carterae.1
MTLMLLSQASSSRHGPAFDASSSSGAIDEGRADGSAWQSLSRTHKPSCLLVCPCTNLSLMQKTSLV